MAPSNKNNKKLKMLLNYLSIDFLKKLFTDHKYLPIVSVFLIIIEFFICIFIIQNVPYTEIDWKAYMQEVEGVINGTFDYSLLKGT